MDRERELDRTGFLSLSNILFDESGYFLMFPTMLGVKMVNLYTNQLVKIIGKTENLRILKIALFQVGNFFIVMISSREVLLNFSYIIYFESFVGMYQ